MLRCAARPRQWTGEHGGTYDPRRLVPTGPRCRRRALFRAVYGDGTKSEAVCGTHAEVLAEMIELGVVNEVRRIGWR